MRFRSLYLTCLYTYFLFIAILDKLTQLYTALYFLFNSKYNKNNQIPLQKKPQVQLFLEFGI